MSNNYAGTNKNGTCEEREEKKLYDFIYGTENETVALCRAKKKLAPGNRQSKNRLGKSYPWPSRLTSSFRNRFLKISSLLGLSTSSTGVLHCISNTLTEQQQQNSPVKAYTNDFMEMLIHFFILFCFDWLTFDSSSLNVSDGPSSSIWTAVVFDLSSPFLLSSFSSENWKNPHTLNWITFDWFDVFFFFIHHLGNLYFWNGKIVGKVLLWIDFWLFGSKKLTAYFILSTWWILFARLWIIVWF